MKKVVTKGAAARNRLLQGVLAAARAVAVTYGPAGRTCILDRMQGLLATKDGVTVAREITLADPLANQGALALREACVKVNNEVGDGTTTVAVLTGALLAEGQRLVAAGVDPMQLAQGMRDAATAAWSMVAELAAPITSRADIARVALLASNGDEEISHHLAEACMAAGKDGIILIEDGEGVETTVAFKDGLEVPRPPFSPAFLKDKVERVLDGPLVAVVNRELTRADDVVDLLETASQWRPRELLLFTPRLGGEALTTVVMNDEQGVVKCVALPPPGIHYRMPDYLQDIAALAGADFVDPEAGYDHRAWQPEWFGALRKATVTGKATVLQSYDEAADPIKQRLAQLRAQEQACSSDYDRDRLRERISHLSGGLAILRVGGVTEAALKERRARVEDALAAVRAALQGGVVPGAGAAYYWAGRGLSARPGLTQDQQMGWELVQRALAQPLLTLVNNAGQAGPMAVEQLKASADGSYWLGWDVRTGALRDVLEDPLLVDPTKVVQVAIQTAVMTAAMLLTVEAAVTLATK